jgi:hypothetical protein
MLYIAYTFVYYDISSYNCHFEVKFYGSLLVPFICLYNFIRIFWEPFIFIAIYA